MLPIFIGIRTKLNRVTFMFVLGNILHCLSNMFMTLIEYRGAKYFMILEFYKLQFFLLYRFIQGEGKIRTKIIFSSNGKKIKTKENLIGLFLLSPLPAKAEGDYSFRVGPSVCPSH